MATLGDFISSQQRGKLEQALRLGQYSLLLGAGASLGGQSADGEPLPSGPQLRAELIRVFGHDDEPGANLGHYFEFSKDSETVDGTTFIDYLTARFVNTVPPRWMQHLPQLAWRGIWTLNIDDCVERSYANATPRAQDLISRSWREKPYRVSDASRQVLISHLHGKASHAARPDELVFTVSQYASALESNRSFWRTNFDADYSASPFLVIGARVMDELDLEQILQLGQDKDTGLIPNLAIAPDLTALQRRTYERFGLIPVEMTAEQFFDQVLAPQLRQGTDRTLPGVGADHTVVACPAEIAFTSQWTRLQRGDKPASGLSQLKFFSGHEPEWGHIIAELPGRREVVAAAVRKLTGASRRGKTVMLTGDRFTGKSTALLMIAKELIERQREVFLFVGDEKPNLDAIKWAAQHYQHLCLLVDDGADFAIDFQAYSRTRASETPLDLMITGRSSSRQHIGYTMAVPGDSQLILKNQLTIGEVNELVKTLEMHSRLGSLARLSQDQRLSHFQRYHRQLFGSLAAIEGASGFVSRFTDIWSQNVAEQDFVANAVALIGHWSYDAPLSLLSRLSQTSIRAVRSHLTRGSYQDIFEVGQKSVRMAHRYASTLVTEEVISNASKLQTAKFIAVSLAPDSSLNQMRDQRVEYRILRQCMDAETVGSWSEGEAWLDFYDSLEHGLGWNSRYWEQRALVAAHKGFFDVGYSWAQRAVSMNPDRMALTTLGSICFRRALDEKNRGPWPFEMYKEAEAALREARIIEGSNADYPFETYFTNVLRLLESGVPTSLEVKARLNQDYLDWRLAMEKLLPEFRQRYDDRAQILSALLSQ